jgi:selenocysteine lyase/cysteine desulfurase
MKLSYPRNTNNKLFGFPAKSNYSGVMHDLKWVEFAQEKGWDVVLDAAAFMANNRLDLSVIKPDFIPISFYKMFGYPTGLGCLIIKKEKYAKLDKRWFSGGSILLVSVMKDFFAPETVGYARYEDGTINFANIPAIKNGLKFVESLGDVKPRVVSIASWLHQQLSEMKVNGNSIAVYNTKGNDTVAFNIKKGEQVMDAWYFEQAASKAGIFVRTGCFCDPGANEEVFQYKIDNFEKFYNSKLLPSQMTIENLREYSGDVSIGAIRASFGYANNFDDVQKFAEFTKQYLQNL